MTTAPGAGGEAKRKKRRRRRPGAHTHHKILHVLRVAPMPPRVPLKKPRHKSHIALLNIPSELMK